MYTLRDFSTNWYGNVLGGITAGTVALPLALAFGIASGAGPVAGLYGAIIVGIFAAVFGGTPTQISGPTGPMTVVITAMVAQFTAQDPVHGMALAFTTIMLGGLLQVSFGLLRLGKYIIQVPYPVISGFMTGIGVIIILLQIAPVIGVTGPSTVIASVRELPDYLTMASPDAIIIGSVTLAIVVLWRGKWNRWVPSPVLGLVVATVVVTYAMPGSNIPRIGEIPSGLPSLQMPVFRADLLYDIVTNALMLAVLGSIDSLLTSLVADNLTGTQHESDRELVGQGVGNTVAGLFGALPGAGATMRTVVNLRAGGTGPLSGVVHALTLLLVVLALGFAFRNIPLAALAAVLIKVGIDIIDWPFLKRILRLPRFPVFLMLLVLALTVFVDLITAVFVGVFIKNIVTVNRLSELELGSVVLTDGTKNTERLPDDERTLLDANKGEVTLLRITGPISYAVARGLKNRLSQLDHRAHLLIDITDAEIIGISTAMVLEELVRTATAHETRVHLIDARRDTRLELRQLDLLRHVGEDFCYNNAADAFGNVRRLTDRADAA